MTEFYNRYWQLFKSGRPQPKASFASNKQFFEPEAIYSQLARPRNPTNHLNIGRSPALDEFQKSVLPRFRKPYPQQLRQLKTEMDESNLKMAQNLQKSSSPALELYQLPKIYGVRNRVERQRVMTEGGQPAKRQLQDAAKINKNIEQLQKQYFSKPYPRQQDRVVDEFSKEQYLPQSRERILKKDSRVAGINKYQAIQRWDIKVLPSYQRQNNIQSMVPSPRQTDLPGQQYRVFAKRQNQLYGLRENQYAFVNSKLDEIKRSERYYPRGYINSYRDALYRRRRHKNHIEQSRARLKLLLYEQERILGGVF